MVPAFAITSTSVTLSVHTRTRFADSRLDECDNFAVAYCFRLPRRPIEMVEAERSSGSREWAWIVRLIARLITPIRARPVLSRPSATNGKEALGSGGAALAGLMTAHQNFAIGADIVLHRSMHHIGGLEAGSKREVRTFDLTSDLPNFQEISWTKAYAGGHQAPEGFHDIIPDQMNPIRVNISPSILVFPMPLIALLGEPAVFLSCMAAVDPSVVTL